MKYKIIEYTELEQPFSLEEKNTALNWLKSNSNSSWKIDKLINVKINSNN